jgi:predicted SnoaL-like aldol condensation-catalyzing enzyme
MHNMKEQALEVNKKIVVEFYELIINKKDFESARKFMGDCYKQHNPKVADGPEGLRAHIEDLRINFPDVRSEIKKIIAEGDYVVLHVHSRRTPKRQLAIIEIFRLENSRIVEHWDVVQEIPETSANSNEMF